MHTDFRGHKLTTSNELAAKSCANAMDSYMQRKSDVTGHLQAAIEHDPECAIAHAYQGLMLHGAKNATYQNMVNESLAKAKQFSSNISDREHFYIKALEFASKGQLLDAVSCFEAILETCPTDGFALSLCQAELFWLGDMRRSLAASSLVAPHWNGNIPGYSEFLAMHAFDLEEAGQYQEAEAAGRLAVDIQPANIWATHAVTHVMYMQGRHTEGIDWISGLQDNWQDVGQMQFHVWWHKCLFHLERAEHDAVLEGYDNWVRNREHSLVQALPDLYIDLQNGSSLLWRLELAGVDVAHRWQEMADVVVGRVADMSSPFTSAHFAVILAAVKDFSACEQLIDAIKHYSHNGEGTLTSHYAKAALPAAQAAVAHRRGEYQQVVDILYPARKNLWLMGGSHAQQDLFFQILLDAAAKCGDQRKVDLLLGEIEQIGFVEPAQLASYKLIKQQHA